MRPTLVANTTPYSWPWDGKLDPARLALVVVAPGDAGVETTAEVVWTNVGALAAAVSGSGGVVLEIRTTSPARAGVTALPAVASSGATFTSVAPGNVHAVIESAGIDGFYGSRLDSMLRAQGRDQLLMCGHGLETGVHSTMRSANDRGYECLLVLDASVPLDPTLITASKSQVEMSGGIFGAVGDVDSVLAAVLSLSSTESPTASSAPARTSTFSN